MRKVERKEILSVAQYEKVRDQMRTQLMKTKEPRRIHLGEHLTFLFENHDTTLYQIQEMLRAERIEDEAHILHEIETYNELVGERGELGCTLLIEIDDVEKRAELLSRWIALPQNLFIKTQDGARIMATFDERQVGERRISSVHYLKFKLGDKIPVALGSQHPELSIETPLLPPQSAALCADLMAK
ncbi:MAG: hypothetical protein RI932_2384 [Pseudomonadota bacterium]|jgi:hypothetical protein